MASAASVSSLGGPGGYVQNPFPLFPSAAPKPTGNSFGGPGGGVVQTPGITAQMTPINPHTGMALSPPPAAPNLFSPFPGMPQFGNAPGNVMAPNPPINIPGLFANQQAMVGSGMYSGMQPSQMSPDFLSALSMVGLGGQGSTNPSPANGGTPGGGLGGFAPDTIFAGGTPGFYPWMAGYEDRLAAGLPVGAGNGGPLGSSFGGFTPNLPPVMPLPQQTPFTPPLPFSWGARGGMDSLPSRRSRWGSAIRERY